MAPSLLPLILSGEPGWTASRYMPSVKVEVAFNAGYTTPSADRVWTDVSEWVELSDRISVGVGRQDERSTADANQLTLTLDNTDGRFTALRSASPYYPNVKIGRPIRVSVMTVTGHTSVRFVGFIDQWPVEWDGSDAYAKATITAASRLARLGLSAKMRSMIESEILDVGPVRYWTLGDASGSTSASDSSRNGGSPAVSTSDIYPITYVLVVFGNATGPGSDGLTAAQFSSAGSSSSYKLVTTGLSLAAGPRTIRFWILATAASSIGFTAQPVSGDGLYVNINSSGVISGPVTTGPNIVDSAGHDVCIVRDGTNEIFYVDGVQVSSVAAGNAAACDAIAIGRTVGAEYTLAHVAVYDFALTPAQVASHAEAILTGFTGDRTDERLTRLLGWAGVAPAEITAETGSELMTYQETSGNSVVDALRDVESTEGGVLFDGPDGNVRFHNRSRRYLATTAATLDMASQHVGSDYAPKVDRSTLVNDVEVSNPTTGEKARSVDTASSDEYGIATGSATSVASTYDPLQQKAAWLITSYAEPRMRVPSLTVDVLAHQGLTPSAETLLGVTVGGLIAVTNAPAQSDTTSPSYFVEGYSETIGPESYQITYNLSPTYPTLNTFILDDPVRGVLDASNILAY